MNAGIPLKETIGEGLKGSLPHSLHEDLGALGCARLTGKLAICAVLALDRAPGRRASASEPHPQNLEGA